MGAIKYLSFDPKSPADGYWDQAFIKDILDNKMFEDLPVDGEIVILPGAYQAKYIREINKYLSQFKWIILFITSDEESKFPVEQIKHSNIVIYVQYPKKGRHDKYQKLPLGYTSETRKNLVFDNKSMDYFFSGQVTHLRRIQCFSQLSAITKGPINGEAIKTDGFAKGIGPMEYMYKMSRAKVAPAPTGPVSADSFRTYEALEAGTIPITDNISMTGDGYWDYLFDGLQPFPTINEWENLPGYINDMISAYPNKNNIVQAWWIAYKKDLRIKIVQEIERLSGEKIYKGEITVIIPVSPIKSHPSIRILEETVKSIKINLPDAPIIITFDGIRKEADSKREAYQAFIREVLFRCNTDWDAYPIIFKEHTHQVGMARAALDHVYTPQILYCEQDTPLVTDEPIEWEYLNRVVGQMRANVIRLHFEARIPKDHEHLMLGGPEQALQRTIQWSQRPHLASTDFYRWMLETHFSQNAKCFIEDKIHGVVQQDYSLMGMRGWEVWKLFIYTPSPTNIKRSLNLDGREGEEKFDGTQIW